MAPTRTARLAAAALAGAFAAYAAGATEYTQYLSVPYAPIAGEAGCEARGLLSLPPAWMTGDAAALVLTRPGLVDPRRDAALAALLADGAAVLEIVGGAGTGCGGAGRAIRGTTSRRRSPPCGSKAPGWSSRSASARGPRRCSRTARASPPPPFSRAKPRSSARAARWRRRRRWRGRSALLCAILAEAAGHSDPRPPDGAGIAGQCRAALGRDAEPVTPVADPAPWPR